MGVTLVAILPLFGIHLLSILQSSHGFQEKYIEFGLNITLASKQTIRARLEAAISRSHQSPRSFRCLYASSSRNTFRRLLQMFLLLGGNIESNPGPQYKHPCGVCTKSVISYQNGIQCDMWSGSMQSVMLLICKCMRFSAIHLSHGCVQNAGSLTSLTHFSMIRSILSPHLTHFHHHRTHQLIQEHRRKTFIRRITKTTTNIYIN